MHRTCADPKVSTTRRPEAGPAGGACQAGVAAAARHLAVQAPQRHPHHGCGLQLCSLCCAASFISTSWRFFTVHSRACVAHLHVVYTSCAAVQASGVVSIAGGWYFEWVGYDSRQRGAAAEHPAWLEPAAMVLRAAFETLQVRHAWSQQWNADDVQCMWRDTETLHHSVCSKSQRV